MLPEKLTTLRKEKGLSQNELAEMLYVTRQAVSRWETGEAAPSVDNLIALRDLYGVSVDYLLFDEWEEGEPGTPAGPVKAVSPPAPGRPIRSGIVPALLTALTVLLASLIAFLIWFKHPEENKDPFAGFDDSYCIYDEDGNPIQGDVLEGYDEYSFSRGEFS